MNDLHIELFSAVEKVNVTAIVVSFLPSSPIHYAVASLYWNWFVEMKYKEIMESW